MEYGVQLVRDDQLPDGIAWVIAVCSTRTLAIIKRSAVTAQILADCWAAYRHAVAEGEAPRLRLVPIQPEELRVKAPMRLNLPELSERVECI
jgi:hypothetical protein